MTKKLQFIACLGGAIVLFSASLILFMLKNSNNDLSHDTVSFPVSAGNNISLNLLQDKNADVLFDLVRKNRTYLRRWLPWLDIIQTSADESYFISAENHQWQENKGLTLGIWYKLTLVGVIGFHNLNLKNQTADIGYWIDEGHQGKGIVTQACRKLIDIGFQKIGLSTIFISCAEENYKSHRIPIKLGFSLYQTIKKKEWLYDHYVNHRVYRLMRSE